MRDRDRVDLLRELCELLIRNLGACESVMLEMERKCGACPRMPLDARITALNVRRAKDYIDEVFVPSVVMSEGEQDERLKGKDGG